MRSTTSTTGSSSAGTSSASSESVAPGRATRVDRSGDAPMAGNPEASIARASGSSGSPLPSTLESRLSGALDADVSNVRVHRSADSESAAASIGAKAYTVGSDIHFGAGHYDPDSSAGQHLIAHEVAHTVQQAGGAAPAGAAQPSLEVSSPGDAHEVEAESFASSFVSGGGGAVSPVSAGTVSRSKISRIPIPADIAAMTRDQCITLVTDIYQGTGSAANEGIFNYKMDTVDEMNTELGRTDPTPISSVIALAVLSVGIAAAAAALLPILALPATAILGPALIAGGAAMVTALPTVFMASDPSPINVARFILNYKTVLRNHWKGSVTRVTSRMTDDTTARQGAAEARAAKANYTLIQANQRHELLDEWLNAVNAAVHNGADNPDSGANDGTAHGMGNTSIGDSTEGRLSLWNAYARLDGSWNDPAGANIEGLPNESLRAVMAARTVGSLNIARTMSVMTTWGLVNLFWSPGPSGERGMSHEDSPSRSKYSMMASFYLGRELDANDAYIGEGDHDQALIDANWQNGVFKAWDAVKNKTVGSLNGGRPLMG